MESQKQKCKKASLYQNCVQSTTRLTLLRKDKYRQSHPRNKVASTVAVLSKSVIKYILIFHRYKEIDICGTISVRVFVNLIVWLVYDLLQLLNFMLKTLLLSGTYFFCVICNSNSVLMLFSALTYMHSVVPSTNN